MKITNRYGMIKAACAVILFVVLLLACGAAVSAETIQTAATGQKYCYSEMGSTIACEGTGQDGEFQAGAQWPSARFAANPDGCSVVDTLTGLMWARNAKQNCTATWITAMTYGETLSLCGYSDWRVANVNELESLVNAGSADLSAWLGSIGFTNLQFGYYFSSTSYLNDDTNNPSPWSMSVQDGTGTGGPGSSTSLVPLKSSTACIMLVRLGMNDKSPGRVPKTGQEKCYDEFNAEKSCVGTGQDGYYQSGAAWSNTRFNDNQDGTVTDQFTNLTWTMDSQTPGVDPAVDPNIDPVLCVPGEKKTWRDALDYVKYCLNSATDPSLGYRDWRLPNRAELASLVDRSQANPALPSGFPFVVTDVSGRWTSTTFMKNRSSAWVIDLYYGDVLSNPKASVQGLYVWPVRGGYPMLTAATASTQGPGMPGTGTVTKGPLGADCSTYCDVYSSFCCGTTEWPEGSDRYTQGRKVVLTAKPDKGSVFAGWSGYPACEGKKGTCTVTMADDLTLAANFASQPTAAVSPPTTRNFGRVKVGKTASATFTVRNTTTNGKQDLTIGSIAVTTGTDFSIPAATNKCATGPLGAGKSCTFKVSFTPTATGALNDTVTIPSDDPDPARSNITVTLTGQGM